MTEEKEKMLSLIEAAEYCHVTKQAIYVAIVKGRLNAVQEGRFWFVSIKQLDDYRLQKYDRSKRIINGELLFDMDKGRFSVPQASKLLGLPKSEGGTGKKITAQKIYYWIRSGQINAEKVGCAWILTRSNIEKILEKEIGSEKRQMRFA